MSFKKLFPLVEYFTKLFWASPFFLAARKFKAESLTSVAAVQSTESSTYIKAVLMMILCT